MTANLGVAWIQIKPSLRGVTKSIQSELQGVGDDQGDKIGSSFTAAFAVKFSAINSVIQPIFSKMTSLITGQLADAINRVDILERFPKVMEMMGFESNVAANAVQKLRDGVTGIPTSLADVVSGTQRLAAITGDVDRAADWALALSDAMVLTTGDVNEANRGFQQFLQVLSRGKPAGDDWNTIMEVASPVMNRLAQSLGYASAQLGGDFYTALQDGTLSINEMMDALVRLDTEGGDGLSSLHEGVKTSSGGIEATMTALKQSISNALVGLIQSIGTENIIEVINAVKTSLGWVLDRAKDLIDFLKENWSWLQYVLGVVAAFFATVKIADWISKTATKLKDLGSTISGIFGKGASKKLDKQSSGMFGGIGTGIKNALTTIKEILGEAVNVVMEPIKTLLKGVGDAIAGFFTALADPAIAMGALMFAAAAASIAAAIVLIGGAIGLVTPALAGFFEEVLRPLGNWLVEVLLVSLSAITDAIIRLTNEALIPLVQVLTASFVLILQTITDTITTLTNSALIPLINTLSGSFTSILNTVGDILNNTIKTALEGVKGIIEAVGDGFEKMGVAIRNALDGVQGILQTFSDMITNMASSIVAIVSLATGQSINYGYGYAHLFADGGRVFGPGTATSDSVPARLSSGEYVIRAAAAQRIGYDNLDSLNADGDLRGGGQNNYFTINGYNKSPEELANIISRKIAFNQRGVIG